MSRVAAELEAIAARLRPLTPPQALRAALVAIAGAESVLERHFSGPPPVYYDSVVGMRHTFDAALSSRALAWVRRGTEQGALAPSAEISHDYREPIAAMQDDDLEFPEHIELAWYAIYNLYRAAVGEDHREPAKSLALAVHQALAARWQSSGGLDPFEIESWWSLVERELGR